MGTPTSNPGGLASRFDLDHHLLPVLISDGTPVPEVVWCFDLYCKSSETAVRNDHIASTAKN